MQVLRETNTVWNVSWRVPCHTYYLDGNKMVGYLPEGKKVPVLMSKPIAFDRRGRTFQFLNRYPPLPQHNARPTLEVSGSKGENYQVVPGVSCTCPGFKFRGACKHLKQISLAFFPG